MAIRYGPTDAYNMKKLTVLSFGTGCRPQFVALKDIANPDGSDVKFWLQWLMTEAGDDASDMQNAFLRAQGLFGGFEFRRFQISLDRKSIRMLPNKGDALTSRAVNGSFSSSLRDTSCSRAGDVVLPPQASMANS